MPDPATKRCSKCSQVLPLAAFGRASDQKDGLARWCRKCKKASGRRWYLEHREETNERSSQWYRDHREEAQERGRQYRRDNPRQLTPEQRETRREASRQWRLDNPERNREGKRQWNQNHPDERRESAQRHRARNPLYKTWEGMLARCENPQSKDYKRYGARGIAVCAEWHDYQTFVADIERLIGLPPEGKSLDRRDNNGSYESGNVRWATPKEQAANRRPPKRG